MDKFYGIAEHQATGNRYKIIEYTESDGTKFWNVYSDSMSLNEIYKCSRSGYYNLNSLFKLKNLVLKSVNEKLS